MKVLLFANVGGGSAGFYHVGDEAMLYQEYLRYTKNRQVNTIGIVSSSYSHQHLNCQEHLNLPWPTDPGQAQKYWFTLLIKSIIYALTKKSLYTEEQLAFVAAIEKYDRIHFSGGGNLTSVFSWWLYYSLFIISTGWLLGKEVILTSQTIGPFTFIDTLCTGIILNLCKKISIREPAITQHSLWKYGVIFPKVTSTTDAATTLSKKTSFHLRHTKKKLRIGLSLHEWQSYSQQLIDTVVSLINALSTSQSIEVILIPHVITKSMDDFDSKFMRKIIKKLSPKIKVVIPTYNQLMKSSVEPASTFKSLTSEVDVLISSRYHGLVFALSTNTPCIGFLMDEYYDKKNKSLYEWYYPKENISAFFIDLNSKNSTVKNVALFNRVLNQKKLNTLPKLKIHT